ncbi:hypothetical protein GWI33_010070 [Rhynchophorus ferrugineus]|uniref:Rhodanese domain-containing protein n=1 Tax=Rhynchophorus ferrugineus TaxID=354439 RepID=A0A834I8N0_RHYFE|nr:hypothetical protein GWI33_010070 [Rhynchophorus ferrugineus]
MGNHPILFGILGVLIVLFFVLEGRRSGRKISPQSLGILTKAQNAQLIDLRDSKDFKQGHISGSRNIPYSQLEKHIDELKNSSQPLIFICNMGQVAGTALQKVSHHDSYRLDGGIMNWKAEVVVYSTTVCPYCTRAKQLLERKGVAFKEVNLSKEDPEVRIALMQRTNHRTVPQIFIKDQFIGGFDELYALERQGQLDELLKD